MSKIDKLVQIKSEDNLLDNEVPLNIDEKQRILKITMDKIPTNKTKVFSKKKLLIGVLVATMMVGTVAMASEYFELNLDNKLLSYLKIDKHNEQLNGAGAYINKSVTDNNLKLNIKQTLGDKHSVYILVDVEVPEDIIIPEYASFNQSTIMLKKQSSAGWAISDLEDENINDNKKSYLISYSTEGELNKNEITLDFKDFGYYSDKSDDFIPLVKGNWKISWELDYTDVSKEISVNRFVSAKDNKFFVRSVNISPISVSANIIGKNNGNFTIQEVTLKDGTSYKGEDFNSMGNSSSLLKAFTSVEFGKVIDINQIESITIDGEVIKLENN
ncbi:MAG: DUF4179 domain-containing protein [Peptostreptococcaceae bacterium]